MRPRYGEGGGVTGRALPSPRLARRGTGGLEVRSGGGGTRPCPRLILQPPPPKCRVRDPSDPRCWGQRVTPSPWEGAGGVCHHVFLQPGCPVPPTPAAPPLPPGTAGATTKGMLSSREGGHGGGGRRRRHGKQDREAAGGCGGAAAILAVGRGLQHRSALAGQHRIAAKPVIKEQGGGGCEAGETLLPGDSRSAWPPQSTHLPPPDPQQGPRAEVVGARGAPVASVAQAESVMGTPAMPTPGRCQV